MLRLCLLALLSCLFSFSPALGAQSSAADTITRQPITLTVDGGKRVGYLIRPTKPGRYPAVVCNHGFNGRGEEMLGICATLARFGYVTLALDFRGCGNSEGQAEFARGETADCLAAIAYLRAQAYVDPERVGVLGAGMGGMVALLTAASDPRVNAVVGLMTPTDCALYYESLRTRESPLADALARIAGGTPAQRGWQYQVRSPLRVAAKISAPVLLLYGGKDEFASVAHGTRLRESMESVGRSCAVKVYPDEGNTFTNPVNAADSVLEMLRFLNDKLGNAPTRGSLESCLMRHMEMMQALHRCQAAGTPPPRDILDVCEMAEAALEARKYAQAERLFDDALALLRKRYP